MEANDSLIFILGLAAVSFVVMLIFRILLPNSWIRRIYMHSLKLSNEVAMVLIIWLFVAAGNIIYLTFVGGLELTLSEGVKISIFSTFPSIILKLADVNMALRSQLRLYVKKNLKLEHEMMKSREMEQEAVLLSMEGQTEKFSIQAEDIMMVKSADNYVEVYYKSNDTIERKLIRNTLKNVQAILAKNHDFQRCHRTCLVNTSYILNMTNSYKGHRLIMLDMEEEIPVSRQYLLGIKEALDAV